MDVRCSTRQKRRNNTRKIAMENSMKGKEKVKEGISPIFLARERGKVIEELYFQNLFLKAVITILLLLLLLMVFGGLL